jgi:pimeloyl-ACP methyl ester carboxylesterase
MVRKALSLFDSGDPFGHLGPIDLPVRINWGTADRVLRRPGHHRRLRRLLPDADGVAVTGSATWPCGTIPRWRLTPSWR